MKYQRIAPDIGLRDATYAKEFLEAALNEGDPKVLSLAMVELMRARGGLKEHADRIGTNANVLLVQGASSQPHIGLTRFFEELKSLGVKLTVEIGDY